MNNSVCRWGHPLDQKKQAATTAAVELGADIILLNAPMAPGVDKQLKAALKTRTAKRQKAVVILVTAGGSADVAYRAGRALQIAYSGNITACVAGWCKSAGTLLAIGAKELIVGPDGELGPLDVQLVKKDAIGDRDSGLIMNAALENLRGEAFKFFEQYMIDIIAHSQSAVTFRTAAEIAADLTAGLMAPVFDKIDPARLGADARAMSIGGEYAKRLNMVANNLRGSDALNMILNGYPTHSFVIDIIEASMLFTRVNPLAGTLSTLVDLLGNDALIPVDQPNLCYLDEAEGGEADGRDPEAGPPAKGENERPEGSVGSAAPENIPGDIPASAGKARARSRRGSRSRVGRQVTEESSSEASVSS